jgi:NADH-quinone oxidoreductase subunit K
MIGVTHYLVVSALLLAVGLYLMMAKRNAVAVFMGVELALNAANLNFLAFARHLHVPLTGQSAALFVIVLAAAEAAVALAVMLTFHSAFRSVDVDRGSTLRE